MTKTIFYCFVYALLNVSGAALIKLKIKNTILSSFADWISFLFTIQVIIAFICIFISALVLFKALSTGSFTLTIPIATGINFIFTVIIGYFLFSDHLNFISFLGFALILSGIIILSLNNTQHVQ